MNSHRMNADGAVLYVCGMWAGHSGMAVVIPNPVGSSESSAPSLSVCLSPSDVMRSCHLPVKGRPQIAFAWLQELRSLIQFVWRARGVSAFEAPLLGPLCQACSIKCRKAGKWGMCSILKIIQWTFPRHISPLGKIVYRVPASNAEL